MLPHSDTLFRLRTQSSLYLPCDREASLKYLYFSTGGWWVTHGFRTRDIQSGVSQFCEKTNEFDFSCRLVVNGYILKVLDSRVFDIVESSFQGFTVFKICWFPVSLFI